MVDQTALKSLEDLHRLKTDGVITEEDFEKAKQRLLFGGATLAARPVRAGAGASLGLRAKAVPRPEDDDHFGWITLALKRFADFEGRSCQREFWMFQLIFVAIGVIVFGGIFDAAVGTGALGGLTLVLCVLTLLVLTVPLIAVQVRRLHDQDRPGLLVLINLVPYLGSFILYVLMAMEGTKGDNQYGPDPKTAVTYGAHQEDEPETPVA